MKEIISPVDTEDGLFHDGDPSTGTEGTVVSQKWLNPVQGAVISNQQEMAAVLKEAGIKIDPSKQDQLLAAIKKITGTATEGFLKIGDYGLGAGPNDKPDAYQVKSQIYRLLYTAKNRPGNSVYGVISLRADGPVDGGRCGYFAVGVDGSAYIGISDVDKIVKWNQLYSTANKPTAADINVYTKQEADGRFAFKSITVNGKPLSSNVNLTAGDVNAWNKTEADGRFIYKSGDTIAALTITKGLYVGEDTTVNRNLFVGGSGFVEKRGVGDVINNFRNTNGYRIFGAGDLFADIYHGERVSQNHYLGIHVANGGADGWFEFRNDGQFIAGSIVGAGGGDGSKLHPDGNVQGSIWGGYLFTFINNKFNQSIINIYQGSRAWVHYGQTGKNWSCPGGHFVTGISQREANGFCWIEDMEYAPLWKVTPTGQWII